MIPKSKRRTILVNGDEYEYCVTGSVSLYIRNLRTNDELRWWIEWKPKDKHEIKPSDIRTLIEKQELYGVKVQCKSK